ncbi:MAG: zinc-ribbon domain-containing protein [Myxococcales bacterium]|nr:zinc-ribbon domain-containing protein [Myxococcales bacterium]MCB9533804.1 zinc-ribbon domain-containing protein [Myxococcales bacterium]
MIASCPSCLTRFRVPDEHAQRGSVRFKCSKCGALFAVGPAAPEAPLPPPAARPLGFSPMPADLESGGFPAAAVPGPPVEAPPGGRVRNFDTAEPTQIVAPPPRFDATGLDRIGAAAAPPSRSGSRSNDLPGGFLASGAGTGAVPAVGAAQPAAVGGAPVAEVAPAPAFGALPASRGLAMASTAAPTLPQRIPGRPVEPIDAEAFSLDGALSEGGLRRGLEESGVHSLAAAALTGGPDPGLVESLARAPRAPAAADFTAVAAAPSTAAETGGLRAQSPAGVLPGFDSFAHLTPYHQDAVPDGAVAAAEPAPRAPALDALPRAFGVPTSESAAAIQLPASLGDPLDALSSAPAAARDRGLAPARSAQQGGWGLAQQAAAVAPAAGPPLAAPASELPPPRVAAAAGQEQGARPVGAPQFVAEPAIADGDASAGDARSAASPTATASGRARLPTGGFDARPGLGNAPSTDLSLAAMLGGGDAPRTLFGGAPTSPEAAVPGRGAAFTGEHRLSAGTAQFAVAAAPTGAVESVPVAEIKNRIDPLVEFNDLFREIRRAEQGDDRKASERYLDPELFQTQEASAVAGGRAPETKEERDERIRRGELKLRAGGVEAPPPLEPRGADSDIIAAALQDSGLREPSRAAVAVSERPKTRIVDLSDGAEPDESEFGVYGRVAATALVALVTVLGAAGFVAARNDWMLDFRELDQMVGVAFRGQEYDGRLAALGFGRHDGAPAWADGARADAGGSAAIDLGELRGGRYLSTHGDEVVTVDGVAINREAGPVRRIDVVVRLLSSTGDVIASQLVPVGLEVTPADLEAIDGDDAVEALYRRIDAARSSQELGPGQQAVFTAVFPAIPQAAADGATFDAVVAAAERRSTDACWQPTTGPAPASPSEPPPSDAPAAAPADGSGAPAALEGAPAASAADGSGAP